MLHTFGLVLVLDTVALTAPRPMVHYSMADDDVESGQPCLPPNPPPRPRVCHHHHHHRDCEDDMTPKQKADFAVIKFIAGLVLTVMRKFWFTSGTVIFGIFVLFWLYGGLFALLLLLFAFSGKFSAVYLFSEHFIYSSLLIQIIIDSVLFFSFIQFSHL